MDLARRTTSLLAVIWTLLVAGTAAAQTGQQGEGFIILCRDGVTIRAGATSADPNGIVKAPLGSAKALWRAMPDRIADVGPVAAGNAVALITNSFNTVYAFSKATGKQLWHKERWSSNLGSDGRYFYILRNEYWDLQAFEPQSGEVVWSRKLPGQWLGHYQHLLGIDHGLLFTQQAVVDLSRKKVIHKWPREPYIETASVNAAGEIVIGDSGGGITIYDRSFKPLRKLHVEGGEVTEVVTAKEGILAAAYQHHPHGNQGLVTFLSPAGKQVWQFAWSSYVLLPHPVFTLADDAALMIEPDASGHQLKLTSRMLSTGQVNWASEEGFFLGPPVVCGNTVYADGSDGVRGYDLRTGIEKQRRK